MLGVEAAPKGMSSVDALRTALRGWLDEHPPREIEVATTTEDVDTLRRKTVLGRCKSASLRDRNPASWTHSTRRRSMDTRIPRHASELNHGRHE